MSGINEQDLLGFVSSFAGGDGLRVEETLGDGFVRLRIAEAERRQAKHDIRCVEDAVIEMLRNSRDAGAQHIFLGTSREGNKRTIVIVDDGSGIPPSLHERVFDARVTSKLDTMQMDRWGVHGRGMALFSIRENALEAKVMSSDVGMGCAIRTVFDVSDITERADQSTWPHIVKGSGREIVQGPRNIYRSCVEFALEERERCLVYVGSPSEAISSMRARMANASMQLPSELNAAPIAQRAAIAHDSKELRSLASELGICISERNAHRIIKGEIAPLRNAASIVMSSSGRNKRKSQSSGNRKIDMSTEDAQDLSAALCQAFDIVADRYYVKLAGPPNLRVSAGKLTVSYDFVEDD